MPPLYELDFPSNSPPPLLSMPPFNFPNPHLGNYCTVPYEYKNLISIIRPPQLIR